MNLSPGGTKRGQQIQGNFSNSSLKAINKGYQPIMSHAVIAGDDIGKTRLSPYLDNQRQHEDQFGHKGQSIPQQMAPEVTVINRTSKGRRRSSTGSSGGHYGQSGM